MTNPQAMRNTFLNFKAISKPVLMNMLQDKVFIVDVPLADINRRLASSLRCLRTLYRRRSSLFKGALIKRRRMCDGALK
jgi:hypothetical protein